MAGSPEGTSAVLGRTTPPTVSSTEVTGPANPRGEWLANAFQAGLAGCHELAVMKPSFLSTMLPSGLPALYLASSPRNSSTSARSQPPKSAGTCGHNDVRQRPH